MQLQGWIFDLYPSPQGMMLWLIEANQKRHRLTDRFTPAFYVRGLPESLKRLEQALQKFAANVACRFTERRDLWENRAVPVLEVTVARPTQFSSWVRWVHRFDSRLLLFDSDLMLESLYCWRHSVFPLARVEAEADASGNILALECRDDAWSLDYEIPPLAVMRMRISGLSGANPAHGQGSAHGRQAALEIEIDGSCFEMDDSCEPAASGIYRLLKRYDPDLIVTEWGDGTILPLLQKQAARLRVTLPLNRDPEATIQKRRARSYTSYGRILFKDATTTLRGRLHVDVSNSFIADKCNLWGLWELARVTKLPVQYAARTTTGTGISYIQMELAWRDGVLIPEQKAEPEDPKSPDELLLADRGGLVFTPTMGFSPNVAELDFVSQYPSIMARFNISPETVNCPCCPDADRVPELGYRVCKRRRGITSRVVEKLIAKRTQLKQLRRTAPADLGERYGLQRDSLKWLLVCCFGYTGYKNARFGKIEAHEAINTVARETLLVAKEIAEARGFTLLHALVDSLYVTREDAERGDYEGLAEEIERQTKLPIAIEAIYRYVVFLPSRQFADVPVPNRFFAVSESGELKVRGIESRRHDTAPLVSRMQGEVLAILAEAHDLASYRHKLDDGRRVLQHYLTQLEGGNVPIEDLVISKRITRAPRDYQKAGITAIVAQQLFGCGVKLRPGETVEYVITDAKAKVPNERVRAYSLWEGWHGYDRKKYASLLREAFEPFESVKLGGIITAEISGDGTDWASGVGIQGLGGNCLSGQEAKGLQRAGVSGWLF
jgi:DNA polymerase-2